MAIGIMVDWIEEKKICMKWENCGRRAIEEACSHTTQDNSDDPETNMRYSGWCAECGYCEDTADPMMNYIYPLETGLGEEKALEVVQKTCCTVMYNTETDEYFLALCGGGMDLSQDIALAYHIVENWIPNELCLRVCTQKGLSQGGRNYKIMAKAVIDSLKKDIAQATDKIARMESRMVSSSEVTT